MDFQVDHTDHARAELRRSTITAGKLKSAHRFNFICLMEEIEQLGDDSLVRVFLEIVASSVETHHLGLREVLHPFFLEHLLREGHVIHTPNNPDGAISEVSPKLLLHTEEKSGNRAYGTDGYFSGNSSTPVRLPHVA